MPTVERLEQIVAEELHNCSVETQRQGQEQLHQWLDVKGDDRSFCKDLRHAIQETLQGEEGTTVLEAVRHFRRRFQNENRERIRKDVENRKSAGEMHRETLQGFRLPAELGAGIVSFGTARAEAGQRWFTLAKEFSREASAMTGSTAYAGGGPGLMGATSKGGQEAGVPVGGFKIALDNGESAFEQNVSDAIPPENVVIFHFFGPRKICLVDAGMRQLEKDRTAFIFFPGGFGTLDELFEVLTLKQLHKLGTKHPVPIILMNYDGYYDRLLEQLEHCEEKGAIGAKDLALFHISATNEDALDFLANEYNIPEEKRQYRGRLTNPSALPEQPKMDPQAKNSGNGG